MEFLNTSDEYIRKTDLEYRKRHGQYFTGQAIVTELINEIPLTDAGDVRILEPSCGTGEFLYQLLKRFPLARIDAIELDPKLYDLVHQEFPEVNIFNRNTLEYQDEYGYDLIIGNPPYYEFKPDRELMDEYREVINGRVNIFSLFVKKSVDLLRNDGYLAFVIPPSMNNGAYFRGLREYIVKYCDIQFLKLLDSDRFPGANQSVMLLILQKRRNTGAFVFQRDNLTIFTTKKDFLEEEFRKGKTLHERGFKVTTGTVVWNQHREKLSNDNSDILLIWSHNITEKGLELENNPKKQYICGLEARIGPAIVINRVIGQPGRGKLRAALIPAGRSYLAENHVNVITGEGKRESDFQELLKIIKGHPNISELLEAISGNTQLSKNELENCIPL